MFKIVQFVPFNAFWVPLDVNSVEASSELSSCVVKLWMKFSWFCCPLNLWTKDAVDAQNFSRPLIYLSGRRVYLFVYRAQRVQIISECVLICVITYFFNFHFFMCMIDIMGKYRGMNVQILLKKFNPLHQVPQRQGC